MFVHESKYQIRQVFFELIVSPFFLGISATFGMVPIVFYCQGALGNCWFAGALSVGVCQAPLCWKEG